MFIVSVHTVLKSNSNMLKKFFVTSSDDISVYLKWTCNFLQVTNNPDYSQ